jgi:acyl carrier protein
MWLALLGIVVGFTACSKREPEPAETQSVSMRETPSSQAGAPKVAKSTRDATVAKVRRIVAENLGLATNEVLPNAPFSTLRAPPDELALVEMILHLEEEFKIEIADDAFERAAGVEPAHPGKPLDLAPLNRGLTVEKLAGIVESQRR